MATITFVSDGDPYPALEGNPLTNTATRLFPDNPYAISDKTYNYTFNYRGGTNTINPHETTLGAMGIALNGVTMFSPLTPSSTALPGRLSVLHLALYGMQCITLQLLESIHVVDIQKLTDAIAISQDRF